jgi:hypothetical protein
MDKNINQQLSRTVAALSTNTPTKAGAKDSERSGIDKNAIMDVVDRLFAEFELVFHNQYNKAFPTPEKLHYAKKLWFDYLREYSPAAILDAGRQAVRQSEFLPSIATLLKFCSGAGGQGLPEPHVAYREACMASSPKSDYHWSHLAVYYAGKASGWHRLASQQENHAFPIYSRHYRDLCERVAKGEQLPDPATRKLDSTIHTPLGRDENKAKLQQLRRDTGI